MRGASQGGGGGGCGGEVAASEGKPKAFGGDGKAMTTARGFVGKMFVRGA